MAMSNLYQKIAQKPVKKNNQEHLNNMPYNQSHSWMNGKHSLAEEKKNRRTHTPWKFDFEILLIFFLCARLQLRHWTTVHYCCHHRIITPSLHRWYNGKICKWPNRAVLRHHRWPHRALWVQRHFVCQQQQQQRLQQQPLRPVQAEAVDSVAVFRQRRRRAVARSVESRQVHVLCITIRSIQSIQPIQIGKQLNHRFVNGTQPCSIMI